MADKENKYRCNTNAVWTKARGCLKCEKCKRDNCGECKSCKAMPRFGGDGRLNAACEMRRCQKKIAPLQVRRDPQRNTIDKYFNKGESVQSPQRKFTTEDIQDDQLISNNSSKDHGGEENGELSSKRKVAWAETKVSDDEVIILD